jgi:hypothetical protein
MRKIRSQIVLAAVLALLVSGLLGSFPHRHDAATATVTADDHHHATHPPRPVRCLELDDRLDTSKPCALCLFQRTVSQARVATAPSADTILTDRGGAHCALPRVAASSVPPGEPRAPPSA